MKVWARNLEFALGVWLGLAPFALSSGAPWDSWWIDAACGLTLIALATLSRRPQLHRMHLALLPVGVGLCAWGWMEGQNGANSADVHRLLVGSTLLMTAIVPTFALQPPRGWVDYYSRKEGGRDGESSA